MLASRVEKMTPVSTYLPCRGVSNVIWDVESANLIEVEDRIDVFDATPDEDLLEVCWCDPRGLVPTQATVDASWIEVLARVPGENLPLVRLVALSGQLRILDGHHRTCAAAAAGRMVRAAVLVLDSR